MFLLLALHIITYITLNYLCSWQYSTWFTVLYAQYTQCQGRFLPPKEASLTQTSPATAHLIACPSAVGWPETELPQTRFQSPPGRIHWHLNSLGTLLLILEVLVPCKRRPGQLVLDILCERDVVELSLEYYLTESM